MKINLKQLFNIEGESKDFSYSINEDELSAIHGYSFASQVDISGSLFNRAGVVYLEYSVSFTLSVVCDRCLKEFERKYDFDFEHIVVPYVSNDNDEYIVAEGQSIELNEIAFTDLLLQLPSKNLCSDDCKGLCMICGCDLNESECNCLNSEL
ncbi:MAG: DUF177 domain-containing protein [Ruminococcus sp.]|nr:DUF177 domain-containing protein [Ruminococcus sp.]